MPASPTRSVPDYRLFRPIFVAIVSVVWFLLLWAFGYLVAAQLPGEGLLPFRTAWRFFPVGFLPILFFGGPATFIGFLQQHLAGAFILSSQPSAPNPQPLISTNPWLLGVKRLFLFWLPSVLLAMLLLWLTFPHGIGRGGIALVLAGLGAALAGVMAIRSSGSPFFYEIRLSPEQRAWRGSFLSYLFWRHGVPWGAGNGIISAILALAVFPRATGGGYGALPPLAVSLDILSTALILCFFMAVSAHPHAWVDAKLGVISAPGHARSPARGGRITWFVVASVVIALGVVAVLQVAGSTGLTIWGFVPWKGVASTVIAGAAAMATAYWTLAREKASPPIPSLVQD